MKTTKNYAILALVMFLFAAISITATAGGNLVMKNSDGRGIHHRVTVVISGEVQYCNTYLIEIRDEKGQLVAPAQVYTAGISQYDFYERGPAKGIRIARLTIALFGDRYVCATELHATPAIVVGIFQNGSSYRYDLFPTSMPNKQ